MFADMIQRSTYHLDEASLWMAKEIAYPALDIAQYQQHLTHLSQRIQVPADAAPQAIIEQINHVLFAEEGYRGNERDYYDPRNSFLNEVITRKVGIPISLSVLFMAIARRLGLVTYGIGLPGHFIIGCQHQDTAIYIDPFHQGKILDEDACKRIALAYLPAGMNFNPVFLAPQSNPMILIRMLNNLRQIYLHQKETVALGKVLELQKILVPHDMEIKRDLGVVYFERGNWGKAIHNLRAYLFGHPRASDADTVKRLLNEAIEKQSMLN